MRRLLLCLLVFLTISVGAGAQQEVDIALSMCDLDTARSVAIASDIMEGAEAAGYSIEMRSAEHRLSAQISDIYQLIEERPQYLVVAAVKAVGLRTAIRAAALKGIKIIFVDRLATDASQEDILCAIGVDGEWAGGECAKVLAERFEGRQAKILEIQGEAGASTTNGFAKGFRDGLCNYDNLQIAGVVPGGAGRETAQQGVLKFYEENGAKFDAVFGHGDEEGLGAVGALFSLEGSDGIPVVSIGGSDDIKRALAAGRMEACVEITPYYADAVLDAIREDSAGKPVERLQLIRGTVIPSEPYERGY